MDLDLIEVVGLIEDAGIEVVFMDAVQERIKGHEMTAYTRRIFQESFLENEIQWLKKRQVSTVGLYSVTPILEHRTIEGSGATIAVESGGIKLRWAWKAGV